MTAKPIFILSEEEKRNPLWTRLMKHFEERLQELRLMNDATRSEVDTANLRGKIAEIKELIRLNEFRPIQ